MNQELDFQFVLSKSCIYGTLHF